MRRFLNVEGGRTYLAMHAFKYVYAHEITSRRYVCNWVRSCAKSMRVCGEILASVRTEILDIYSMRKLADLSGY